MRKKRKYSQETIKRMKKSANERFRQARKEEEKQLIEDAECDYGYI